MTKNRLWVLGAPDPEMAMVEEVLTMTQETYAYARWWGKRVKSDNAYQAECDEVLDIMESGGTIFLVECDLDVLQDSFRNTGKASVIRIDHHKPGDIGYGYPPKDFLTASSVGQVISYLARIDRLPAWINLYAVPLPGVRNGEFVFERGGNWSVFVDSSLIYMIPTDIVLCAAADHCPDAAYRGECPGVDPDCLARFLRSAPS